MLKVSTVGVTVKPVSEKAEEDVKMASRKLKSLDDTPGLWVIGEARSTAPIIVINTYQIRSCLLGVRNLANLCHREIDVALVFSKLLTILKNTKVNLDFTINILYLILFNIC